MPASRHLAREPFNVRSYETEKRAKRRAFSLGISVPDSLRDLGDERFTAIIKAALDDFDVDQQQLARRLRVSNPTVGRWRSGQCTPAMYARPAIVLTIATMIADDMGFRMHPSTELVTAPDPARSRRGN